MSPSDENMVGSTKHLFPEKRKHEQGLPKWHGDI